MPGPDRDPSTRRRRGVLRHYDRPVWRDRLFWLVAIPSVAATAVFVGLLLVIWGVPSDVVGWLRPVVLGVIVVNLSFTLLGASVTTTRHFQRGLGQGSQPRDGDLEAKGRAAGAVVGKALRSAKAARGATVPARSRPSPTPRPAASASSPGPALDPAPDPAVEPAPGHAVEPAPDRAGAEPDPLGDAPNVPPNRASVTGRTERPPRPPVTADKAARVAGAMVGRRLAERRRRQP
jgi:hypothetical protein